jgi:hypothetical protein
MIQFMRSTYMWHRKCPTSRDTSVRKLTKILFRLLLKRKVQGTVLMLHNTDMNTMKDVNRDLAPYSVELCNCTDSIQT